MSEITVILASLKREISALRVAEDQKTFDEAIKGRKFKNPETGNQVSFSSLPAGEQKKLRAEFNAKNSPSSEGESLSPEAKKSYDVVSSISEEDIDNGDFFDRVSRAIEDMKDKELNALADSGDLEDMDNKALKGVLKKILSKDSKRGEAIVSSIEEASGEIRYKRLTKPLDSIEDKRDEDLGKALGSLKDGIEQVDYDDDPVLNEHIEKIQRVRSVEDLQELSVDNLKVLGLEKLQNISKIESDYKDKYSKAVKDAEKGLNDLDVDLTEWDREYTDLSKIDKAIDSLKQEQGNKKASLALRALKKEIRMLRNML